MADTQWGEEVEDQRTTAKGGVPVWVWGCGGGCLLLLVVGIVLLGIVGKAVKEEFDKSTDPEVQRAVVGQYFGYEQWPEGYELFGIPFVSKFMDGNMVMMFHEGDGATHMAFLMVFPGSEKAETEQIFTEEFEGGAFGFGKWKDAQRGTIELDGREARFVGFVADSPSFGREDTQGPSMMLDLSGSGNKVVLVQVTRVAGGGEPLALDEVREFLGEPFDVWLNR